MERIKLFRLLGLPFALVAAFVPALLAVVAALVFPESQSHPARWLLGAAALGALAALALAAWTAHRVRRDLHELGEAMTAMLTGQGDGHRRVAPLGIGPLNQLAARVNALADDREQRLSEA